MQQKTSNTKIVTFVILVIIIQSYLVPLIPLIARADYTKYVHYVYLHTVISYTIIILSIIAFHADGLDVFQDYVSLSTILISCFLRLSLGFKSEVIYKGILAFLGLLLANHMIVNWRSIKLPTWKSVIVGLFWSVGTVLAASLIRALLDSNHGTLPTNLVGYVTNTSLFQVSFVTVLEESYFRGLLFGFLVMKGFKENSALIFQGIAFWGMHYANSVDPILFWGIIPLVALSTTMITKKYRMLYLSILIHTMNNVFGGLLVALL